MKIKSILRINYRIKTKLKPQLKSKFSNIIKELLKINWDYIEYNSELDLLLAECEDFNWLVLLINSLSEEDNSLSFQIKEFLLEIQNELKYVNKMLLTYFIIILFNYNIDINTINIIKYYINKGNNE